MSFLDGIFQGGTIATDLATTDLPVNVSGAPGPNPGDVLTAVDGENARWAPPSGGGGGGGSDLPTDALYGQSLTAQSGGLTPPFNPTWASVALVFGGVDTPPFTNQWVAWTQGGAIGLPAAAPGVGAGIFTTTDLNVSCSGDASIFYNGVMTPGGGDSFVLIPANTYIEWFLVDFDDTSVWVPRGSSSPGGGAGDGSWLTYSTANQPGLGEWVFMGESPISLPDITAEGQHVGFYVGADFGPALISSNDSLLLGRNLYNGGSNVPISPGGWYEFVSFNHGEDFRWLSIATGDAAKPPLEPAANAAVRPAYPNMWSLGSNDTAIPLPYNPLDGDSYGVYADVACAVFCFDPGADIESPDLSQTVSPPDSIALTAGSYYEWIYTAGDNTWHPRQNTRMPLPDGILAGNGLTRTGKTLNVVANADASIVVNADDIKVGVLATDAQHGTRGGGTLHAVASGSANGFMSIAHFTTLTGLAGGASALKTTGAAVDVSASAPPSVGKILVATDATHATWQAPASGAQIETKMFSADSSAGGNTSLNALGFNVAAFETVILEWWIYNHSSGAATPIVDIQGDFVNTVTRCNIYAQWTTGATTISTATLVVTTLQGTHFVITANTPSGLDSVCTVTMTITNGATAAFIRPFFERTGGPAFVRGGSWGRCTRGAVIS
jgi:hypothetical protein